MNRHERTRLANLEKAKLNQPTKKVVKKSVKKAAKKKDG